MTTRHQSKMVYEGEYAAVVDITLLEEDNAWSPYLSLADAQKLDDVREALRKGDIKSAMQRARVFHLTPVQTIAS